jgi:hypothetical protein
MSRPAGNFERTAFSAGKVFFQLIRVLQMPEAIAQFDHPVFHVTGLPGMQKMIRRRESIHVSSIRQVVFRRMAGSGPPGSSENDAHKKNTNRKPKVHLENIPRTTGATQYSTGK